MRMVAEMDAGPVVFQVEEPIEPGETATELTVRLSEIGAEALVEALALLQAGEIEERAQDDTLATYAPKVDRAVARIDWGLDAHAVANHVRGMDEVPGAWTLLAGQPLKLFRPEPRMARRGDMQPGAVVGADPQSGLLVATGDGAVAFGEAQPAGGRRMPATDWLRGRPVAEGDRFE
jgi:methionyl-tRNA formyltransferase